MSTLIIYNVLVIVCVPLLFGIFAEDGYRFPVGVRVLIILTAVSGIWWAMVSAVLYANSL